MKKLISIALAAVMAAGSLMVSAPDAEAGWKKRGYGHRGYYRSHSYRPYYRSYGYRPYGYYGYYRPTAGEAAGGLIIALIALAAANAAAQQAQVVPSYSYPPPVYPRPKGPLPSGAIGVDVNGAPVCIGGPDRC
jgi:hypothetical protein